MNRICSRVDPNEVAVVGVCRWSCDTAPSPHSNTTRHSKSSCLSLGRNNTYPDEDRCGAGVAHPVPSTRRCGTILGTGCCSCLSRKGFVGVRQTSGFLSLSCWSSSSSSSSRSISFSSWIATPALQLAAVELLLIEPFRLEHHVSIILWISPSTSS